MRSYRKNYRTLKAEESVGTNSVIVYHGSYFAVFNLDDYTLIVADLEPQAKKRLVTWIERQKEMSQPSG
jgi:hypothetical protein